MDGLGKRRNVHGLLQDKLTTFNSLPGSRMNFEMIFVLDRDIGSNRREITGFQTGTPCVASNDKTGLHVICFFDLLALLFIRYEVL